MSSGEPSDSFLYTPLLIFIQYCLDFAAFAKK